MATRRAGFYLPAGGGASGATISHFKFETVEFPVFSRGAEDITVEHCLMNNPVQGITNWHGRRWQVNNNEINDLRTMNGGGIGILFGAYNNMPITDNVAAHNKINGVVYMGTGEHGGYNATGIVLYSDSRYGTPGASIISYNQVIKNKIGLVSDNPELVNVVAIELTDTAEYENVIVDNAVGFNDLRDTTIQIALTPSSLDNPVNKISRNLGENRGHGLHPSAFGPN